MLDLTQRTLPNTVTVDGRDFLIKTDFRIWLQFERDFKQSIINGEPFSVAYIFEDDIPNGNLTDVLLQFARPKSELPRPITDSSGAIPMDFDIDSDLIYSAFFEQYKIDLLQVTMHWHVFLALLKGISDNTQLAKVMGYRCYKKNTNQKRDIHEELRRAWEIIPPLTKAEQEEAEEFNKYFK